MKVLFHKTTQNGCTDKMLDTLFSVVPEEHVHFTCDIETLVDALLKYRLEMPVVVIRISSAAEVPEIMCLCDLLDRLFLIVITENDDKGLLASCRNLYPRLLTHNDDCDVVAAVIEKRLATTSRLPSSCSRHQLNEWDGEFEMGE